jgi:hypothetical protein
MLYQCSCGRQYNADRIHVCPACRLPFGQEPTFSNPISPVSVNASLFGERDQLHSSNKSAPTEISNSPSTGWYPDPNGFPSDRFWDGLIWTEQTRPQARQKPQPTQPRFVQAPGNYGKSADSVRYGSRASLQQLPPQNGMGTAALVLGIIALFTPFLIATLAVIFGYIGLGKCNRGEATNRGMALWGIWLGWISWASWVILYFIIINA